MFIRPKILFVSLLAAALAFAQTACSESEPATRVEVAQAMAGALREARDGASAELAAKKFVALSEKIDKLPQTPQSAAAEASDALSAIAVQARRLEKEDYFGSEALKTVLTRLPEE